MKRALRPLWLLPFVLFTCLLVCAPSALATTVVMPADDDLIIGARAIIIGKVISIETRFDQNYNAVFTYTTLRVNEVLKGQIVSKKITLKELGGEAGEQGTIIFGTPQYAVGERVLLYLDTWSDGSLRTYQMFLGRFSIRRDAETGNLMAIRDTPENVDVAGRSDRGPITDRMKLSAYKRMVKERLSVNWQRVQEEEEKYHKDVPLLPQPPDFERERGSGFEPQFHTFSPPIRWFEPDSGQPVVFYVNTDGAPSPETINDVNAAMSAWSTVAGCSMRVSNGGTTTTCTPTDGGLNTIVFNNCDGWFTAGSTCQSVLARAGVWRYTTSISKVVNGTTFYKALQGHMSFNPYASCYFGNHCNVAEIATHEMGHALGLHHSWDPSFGGSATASDQAATMYYIAHFDGRCASLRTDDINGITFIYPGTGGGGSLAVSTSSLPGAVLNTAYSQTLSATGGTPSYTWSLASGSGPLPPGLSISSSGVISGTPTQTGTYNFTVQVRDSQSATAQKGLSIAVTSSSAQYDSQFVSQTVPTWVKPGQTFSATLTFRNSGTQTWSGSAYYLATQNPPLNFNWLGGAYNAISLSGFTISAGQQLTVSYTFTAPATAGSYNFQWQLYQNGGLGFFGQMSTNVAIQVTRFRDVPTTHLYYTQIEKIAQIGVTAGCGNDQYCPDGLVTREQMSTFLLRAIGASVPTPTGQTFLDVPPSRWSYPFVEEFSKRGFTAGCGNGYFCPETLVSREQMATFMERALGKDPPVPATQRFLDVAPTRWSYRFVDGFIQDTSAAGIMDVIKRGCNADGLHFCPDLSLSRAEMAAWIVMAFGL